MTTRVTGAFYHMNLPIHVIECPSNFRYHGNSLDRTCQPPANGISHVLTWHTKTRSSRSINERMVTVFLLVTKDTNVIYLTNDRHGTAVLLASAIVSIDGQISNAMSITWSAMPRQQGSEHGKCLGEHLRSSMKIVAPDADKPPRWISLGSSWPWSSARSSRTGESPTT